MGLSISQSNAERIRIEQISIKRAKSSVNSEARSADKSPSKQLKDQNKQARAATHWKQSNDVKENGSGKKEYENGEIINTFLKNKKDEDSLRMSDEQSEPHIRVMIPPPQNKMAANLQQHWQQSSHFQGIEHVQDSREGLLRPQLPQKTVRVTPVISQQMQTSVDSPGPRLALHGSKIFPQVYSSPLKEKQIEQIKEKEVNKPRIYQESRTLSAKCPPPRYDKDTIEAPANPNSNLEVEFNNFDWEIPKSSKDTHYTSNRKLKPSESMILTSKLGKQQDQSNGKSHKAVWKNRRELMNEIANDRLQTTSGSFSLKFCIPGGEDLSRQICS